MKKVLIPSKFSSYDQIKDHLLIILLAPAIDQSWKNSGTASRAAGGLLFSTTPRRIKE